MPSLWFVLRRSKNSTSIGAIRMPPAVPLNHPPGRSPPTHKCRDRETCSIVLCSDIRACDACLEHSNFFKVNAAEPPPRTARLKASGGSSGERGAGERRPPCYEVGPACPARAPKSNYELFNCSNVNIRYWSWNYRGCWHQTCPPMAPHTRV